MEQRNQVWRRVGRHLRGTFGAGLLVIVPLAATIVILLVVFRFLDDFLRDLPLVGTQLQNLESLAGRSIPGLGLVLLVILIYLAGLLGAFFIGRRLMAIGGRLINRIPLVGLIYRTTKQATELFMRAADEDRYRKVVLLDFPRQGIKSVGLVTARLIGRDGEDLAAVYVPTTPNPTSGYLVIVPMEQLIPTEISVDEAMKIIISGGILSSDELSRYITGERAPSDKRASNH